MWRPRVGNAQSTAEAENQSREPRLPLWSVHLKKAPGPNSSSHHTPPPSAQLSAGIYSLQSRED